MKNAKKWLLPSACLILLAAIVLTVVPAPAQMQPGMTPQQQNAMGNMQMKMRQQMMAKMHIDPSDPAVLLVFRQELQLTQEQVVGLEKIMADSRSKAQELLTAEQKTKLQAATGGGAAAPAAPQDGKQPPAGKGSPRNSKKGAPPDGGRNPQN
jgi:hypothetical protein